MRAVRDSPDGVTVVDRPEPAGPGRRVDVVAAGICGSDLHLLEHGPLPFTLGHEFAGRLEDGTAVAIDPSQPCGACDQCRAGAPHRCRTGAERALGVAVDGGMAERVLVGATALVPLPAGVPVADGCLVEPLAVAGHGLRLAAVDPAVRVAVVGGGAIGLAAVAAARGRGVTTIGLAARHRHQQEAGERLGASGVGDEEYDVVVEAAGTDSALARAASLCRPGGLVLLLSTHWSPVPVPGIPALMKELEFRWSYTYGWHPGGRDLDDAAALLAREPEIVAALVTHRFPLEDAAEAFRVAADRGSGAIKVVLEP
ncbi:MAG TPA: alcohol dehydrogenase catalytic domain-containing protein [Acidimicrobiia bacterium]|nr:alcohol dehydrogenase catalytic domain-containing protein [Acidimicrobiia bacterium]HEV3450326.1 alcohol dehydrogenase catalytic domain-containing protein [Acidimicrobiia bacterium]